MLYAKQVGPTTEKMHLYFEQNESCPHRGTRNVALLQGVSLPFCPSHAHIQNNHHILELKPRTLNPSSS